MTYDDMRALLAEADKTLSSGHYPLAAVTLILDEISPNAQRVMEEAPDVLESSSRIARHATRMLHCRARLALSDAINERP